MGTRVIFLRHGQSSYNAQGLYQGCCDDSVLTAVGRQTAEQTGAFLRGIRIDAVYTSPLQRARETADLALAALPNAARPKVLPLLREADLPNWEGLSFQTVRDRFPADYACWKQRPHQYCMNIDRGGSEQQHYPARELYSRLQRFWQMIFPYHRHQTILVVAHGGTIRAAIATALGIDPAHYHSIQQNNCALSALYFPTDDLCSARLEGVNLSTHLDWTLPKPAGNGLRLLLVPSGVGDTRRLEALLAAVTIQFSLNDTSLHPLTHALLQSHPETVRLQMMGSEFPKLWQRALKQQRCSDELTTGLIVAPPVAIAPFLGQAIGLQPPTDRYLHLQAGTFSIMHYPANGDAPILQALGWGGAIVPARARLARAAA